MRLITLSLAVGLSVPSLLAQITIGQNEMPHAGDDLFRTRATLNPFLNYTATGPAHNWSFTNLAAAAQDEAAYQTVSSTNLVFAIAYADIFFNPNRANVAKPGVDIAFNQLLPIQDPYTFFYRSASSYREVGFGVQLSGLPVPIIFDEQDEVYALPLHYGDAGASHSAWKVSIPTLAYYGYEQDRTNEVDGWGTITTPAGSFDVLRVMTTLAGRDTINVDTLSLGFAIDRPIVREYKWLAQDLRVPVLQINTAEVFGVEVITDVYFYDAPRALAVAPPLGPLLCAGGSVAVDYEAQGVFNHNILFVPNNTFRAELSDATGDFSNAITIGSVSSTVSGTINATIPANTPPGTGYRIRVVATSPGFTGTDNGMDLTIGTAPQAVATANGGLSFCEGGSVLLSANTGDGLSYQWQLDGTAVFGGTAAELEATTSGAYTVLVTNTCGSTPSNVINVSVTEAPAHTLSATELAACNGADVTIEAVNATTQTDLGYQWLLDGSPIADATTAQLTTHTPGSYTLLVTNTTTGCDFTTDAATLSVESAGTPAISADGPAALCPNGSVDLLTDGAAASYVWYLDGNTIADVSGATYAANVAGSYTVMAVSAHGCTSAPSAALDVTQLSGPDAPSIIVSEPTTFCAGGGVTLIGFPATDLQWTLDGTAIDGATTNQYEAFTSGSYGLLAVDANGCTTAAPEPVVVVVNPLPALPVITQAGDSLQATGEGAFQWYLNGTAIENATDDAYAVLWSGDYTVVVTDANGCSSTSDPFTYISTGVGSIAGMNVGVAPNPSTGAFVITWPATHAPGVYIVTDAAGRRVLEGRSTSTTTTIDLSGHAAGPYLLRSVQDGLVLRLLVN